jgi:PAS domain S-box-containing protein
MFDFLSKLFDTSDFPARWTCGNWTAAHGWLHILSDLGVWSAYVAIPCVLGYFVLRRKDIPFRTIFLLFGAFILACGTTHLMEVLIFWWPAYRLAGVVKLFTAVVSWGTVLALVPVTPKALAMRSPEELEREIDARKEMESALQKANRELERQVAALRASEERFRLLVDGTTDYAIFMLDPSGRVASWNASAQRIKQYRADEIVGQQFSRFYTAEDVVTGKPVRELQVAEAEGRYEEEGWRVRKDGSHFWASVIITALRDEGGHLRGFSKLTRDMTERKKAEDNARRLLQEEAARRAAEENAQVIERQREQLRVTLTSIGDGVITTDAEERATLLNPVAEALTGWMTEDAAGQPLSTVFHIINEKTRRTVDNPVARVIATGHVVGLANHTVLIAKDGTERAIDDSAAPIRDSQGRITGCVLVFRDITERRRAEQKRADDAARIESVVNHVIDGIIAIDENGIVEAFNPAAERLFGYQAEEVIGQNVKTLMPEPFHGEHDGYLAHYRRTGQAKIIGIGREVEGRRKDGSTFPMDLAVSEFWLGKRRYFTGIVRDITDRKQAEGKLLESEQRLAAELEAITRLHALSTRLLSADNLSTALNDLLENAVAACRADFGNIQLYNPQIGALEIVAHRGFGPDFLDYFRKVQMDDGSACSQAMQAGERINIEDVQKDSTYEPHRSIAAAADYRSVNSTPLRDRQGSLIGILSVHFRQPHNTSEREQRFLDLYARHTADLIERNRFEEALKEADRRKDEFLATLAHELRNPLAPIRNALQIVRLSPEPEATEHAHSMMERQLSQLVHLVDDLMDVSRITRGKVELRKERLQLAAVLNSAEETSRPLIEQMGHELTVNLPKQPITVDADLTRLAQAFTNLLNNAAKYTERGGHIWLTAERQGSDVVVSVRDTGIGIAGDQLARIFDMFSQVDRSLDRSQGGLGIGLTLVRRLVMMHNGRIEAKSEGLGRGAEFLVRLPVVVEESVPQAVERYELSVSKSSLRVLIVDDNEDAVSSLGMLLQIMGNDISIAHDGQKGVDMAEEFRPNVVLLDIGLPKLNGYEACRRIREKAWGKNVVLIAVTGWGQEEDRRRSHEAGFDHHMVKPVEPQALLKLLAELQTVADR